MDVTAVCERSGDWWAVSVPEVKGAFTQAKRLDQVPAMVRDAVSLLTGIPEDDVHVTVDAQVPAGAGAAYEWAVAGALEQESRTLQSLAAAARRTAMHNYRDIGLSVRDIAALTGVSYQRVSQILAEQPAESAGTVVDAIRAVNTTRSTHHFVTDIMRTLGTSPAVEASIAELKRYGTSREAFEVAVELVRKFGFPWYEGGNVTEVADPAEASDVAEHAPAH
jgi:hypothetical protein